jgi:hypothetical protein
MQNNEIKLFDSSHCTDENFYENQLLVLKPSSLVEEYRSADYQLFYATAGFGCDPNKLGVKVFGFFLKDDEETSFARHQFMGVVDEQYLPEWAKEKLEEINSQGMEMKGMV